MDQDPSSATREMFHKIGRKRPCGKSDSKKPLSKIALKHDPSRIQVGALTSTYPYSIVIEFLNKAITILVVHAEWKLSKIVEKVKRQQASYVLDWPHGRRSHRRPRTFLSEWKSPVAVQISHRGCCLDHSKTLSELGLGPFTHLKAHMFFSSHALPGNERLVKQDAYGNLKTPVNERRLKRGLWDEAADQAHGDQKRQKYNEPLRNIHCHEMLGVEKKLEVTPVNAARYGLHVCDLEELLDNLDLAGENV